MDPVRELPYGPAACNALHQRPYTCQHPTTRRNQPKKSSCSNRGVHTRQEFRAEVARACQGQAPHTPVIKPLNSSPPMTDSKLLVTDKLSVLHSVSLCLTPATTF